MQIFYYGKNEDQIEILPLFSIYLHKHFHDIDSPWHFHISIQWIFWYFEIQIGKDYDE